MIHGRVRNKSLRIDIIFMLFRIKHSGSASWVAEQAFFGFICQSYPRARNRMEILDNFFFKAFVSPNEE
jgi:hypothetical protein